MLCWIKNKTGQIAVLLALSFGLLTLLVAMVVNIGFLVAAKINLQNSVDMAAYAGAAQQARYLTEIGKWNYEMRRNYKAMVFDYLLTYNAELKRADNPAENEFRMYINNMDQNGNPKETYPLFCASLQGGSGDPESSTSVRKIICQKVKQHTFQDALQASSQAVSNLINTSGVICGIPNSAAACQNILGTIIQSSTAYSQLQQTANADTEQFINYVNGDPKNYNLRLLMWMLHDYRHLQSRIRGVHFGDISIGSNANNNLTGRWDFFKDKTKLSFFQNAPMSVAAKVINGFTSSEDTTTKLQANKANLLENNVELIKNPVNEAAFSTFKNNLMTVIEKDAKLFHLTPQNFNTNSAPDMSGGCSGQCTEFSGPYLKIKEHDINFMGYYTVVEVSSGTVGKAAPASADQFRNIGSFPVGVTKDERLLTYYTVVGTAKTDQIPFNVFFGNQEYSNKDVIMVAVASARPFGSRIGPFINDQCSDLYDGTNKINCIKNGLDPLYPFKGEDPNFPNFSILEQNNDVRKLGVKFTVSNYESQKATQTFPGHAGTDQPFTEFFGVGRKPTARARDFRYKKDANNSDYSMDDGFGSSGSWNPPASDPAFFDHDQTCIHPVGNRNSVWAWWGNITYEQSSAKTVPQNKRANYEGYLELAAQENKALYKFSQLPKRKTSGLIGQDPYTIYVFKYPGINSTSQHDWDIDGLTKRGDYGSWMERAFANTMAVSPFELKRYIIPSRNDDDAQLNYLNAGNKNGFIYHGSPNREVVNGQGNKPFEEVVTGMESTDTLKEQGGIGESYTSWRIGTRGYRVKLVKIKDLVAENCTSKYQNCLNSTYTLDDTGGESFTIDLSKIDY